jgi:sulfur-oxidizing protein SoxY
MKAVPIIPALILASSMAANSAGLPKDPLNSVMWEDIAARFFPGEIVFDERVKLMMPASAENPFSVPITVDASALNGVKEIVVVADLSPLPHVLTYRPDSAAPFIGFRIKVEQATPVRVGVRTADGVWRIGGAVVDAAGGGCSAPARAHANPNWAATLGQTRATVRREDADTARITVRMRHPMDTGLADGIPVFYLSRLGITGKDGRMVASIESREPISENPTFTIKAKVTQDETALSFAGSDTEGNQYAFSLPVPGPEGLAN